MGRLFCLKHRVELDCESHSGAYWCPECKDYPYTQDTYEIPDSNEVFYYPAKGDGLASLVTLEELEEIRKSTYHPWECS